MIKVSVALVILLINLLGGACGNASADDSVVDIEQHFERYDSSVKVEGEDNRVRCAEAFYVSDDGTTYLMDAYNRHVIITHEESIDYFDIKETILPCDMVIENNSIYTFDEAQEEVHVYNLDTCSITKIDARLRDDYFKEFEVISEKVYLTTHKGKIYSVKETETKIEDSKLVVYKTKPSKGFELSEFIASDAFGNTYWLETDIVSGAKIEGTLAILKKDNKLNIVGTYLIPDECSYLPTRFVQVDRDGAVYTLEVTKEDICLHEVSLRSGFELVEKAPTQVIGKGKDFGKVKLDREQVLERALEIVNFEWTFSSKNTKLPKNGSVTLPRELEYIAEKNKDNKNWSETVVGIPYCWGGFSSIYSKNSSISNFNTAIKSGFIAGNTKTTGNIKENTTGLDCSGFVSLVYKLSNKYSTKTLFDISKPVKNMDSMQLMDMIVAPGDHVILFWSRISDDAFLVNEVCARNGKAVTRVRTINWLITDGDYEMRTAWQEE